MRTSAVLLVLILVAPSAAALAPLIDLAVDAKPALEELGFLDAASTSTSSEKGVSAVIDHLQRVGLASEEWNAFDDEEEHPLAFDFAHPASDLNGDEVPDLFINRLDLRGFDSTILALSGKDGTVLWEKSNFKYFPFWARPGEPFPPNLDNVQPMRDLNDDGIGEVLVFGFLINTLAPPDPAGCVSLVTITGAHRILDGRDGVELWADPYQGSILFEECTNPDLVTFTNFPTGLLYFDSPTGPRIVRKFSDVQILLLADPTCEVICLLGLWERVATTEERVQVIDAKTRVQTWQRLLLPTENPRHYVVSWITGAAPLEGSPEYEVVLDELFTHNPHGSELYHPITGDPLVNYGRGMYVRALRGDDGENLWRTKIFEEPPWRVNAQTEDAYPVLVWVDGRMLEDVTGDGVPEVMASYLTQDSTTPSTVNGMYRTHFAPLDGRTGDKLWPENADGQSWHKDRAYMGWGFATTLNTPNHTAPYLAIGTTDLFSRPPPGGRFPAKDIHLAVLKVSDGTPVWSLSQRFPLDTYVSYHMTLSQYLHSLAPYDWDGDGVRDVVTPAQYVKPHGKEQTILANSLHTYQVLSGTDGSLLQTLTAWGLIGQVVPCSGYSSDLTIIAGHSRRMDLSKFNGTTGELLWRKPTYNDPRLRPATAGTELLAFNARCGTADDVWFNFNLAEGAWGRGVEIHPVKGVLRSSTGAFAWINPKLQGNPIVEPYGMPPLPAGGWSLSTVAWTALLAPAVPGLLGGLGINWFLRRRGGRPD